ncbi:chemotaxis protein CheW [Paenibacillus flagellatus]|uniref:Chemotaxis protein CheA n=1 Tax=Paenibacillus flagellatus TaxID=2211139 RepID=A0A2V5JVS4_9BACL|nr:chemotaxis protein CheW [Paenibacillus flagellatus]PYI50728.1 histidine kinase [Paenibacillus flagellatus]
MTDPNMSAYLGILMDELDEQLQILNEQLLELEHDGSNMETIQRIFRAAHTLKGSSAAMGFEHLKELTHAIENVFDKIRNRQLSVSSELVTVLFRAIDYIKVLKIAIIEERQSETDISPFIRMLDEAEHASAASSGDATAAPHEASAPAGHAWSPDIRGALQPYWNDGFDVYSLRIALQPDAEMKQARIMIICNGLDESGHVLAMSPEADANAQDAVSEYRILFATKRDEETLSGALRLASQIDSFDIGRLDRDRAEAAEAVAEPPAETPPSADVPALGLSAEYGQEACDPASAAPEEAGKTKAEASKVKVNPTVRVDVDRLEKLLNFVGELIIDNTRLLEVKNRLTQQFKDHSDIAVLNDISNHLSRVVSELQEGMMKTRMLPIEQLFNRFPRMLRDVALQAGKEIDFVMEGKETELDRTLIEEISDPLIHILRNAADHGIESPEERERLGKPRKGKLILKASHQENQIVISIADDGRGIDPQKIKQASIRKGFITPEEASRMTDKELVFLIFHSGMSTADKVTELSGRGVGMDIVRSHIEKLNGVIDIDTSPGEGTVFTIKLPLTLAIIRSLLVKLGQSTFAIPLVNVLEIVRLQPQEIQTIQGREVCVIRGTVFPLVRMHRRLRLDEPRDDARDRRMFVVVLGIADKRVCLVVDKTLGNQEIVIKSLGRFVGDVPYISGSTILGNGNVALILDVGSVVKEEGSLLLSKEQDAQQKQLVRSRECQLVTFRLGTEHFALDIAKVKEIITVPAITKMVDAPANMLGMINLRGAVLPVFDLRQSFGFPGGEPTTRSRIIVIEAGSRDVGILIDQVTEVVKVQQSDIEAAPDHSARHDGKLIQGIYKQNDSFIVVLNIDYALRTEELAAY